MKKLFLAAAITAQAFLPFSGAFAGDLTLKLTDIRNDNGNLLIAIYKDARDFEAEASGQAYASVMIPAAGLSRTVTLSDFPAGNYAVSVLHDEDLNGRLNLTTHDFPAEGYAYSQGAGKRDVPNFDEASFVLNTGEDMTVTLPLIYVK